MEFLLSISSGVCHFFQFLTFLGWLFVKFLLMISLVHGYVPFCNLNRFFLGGGGGGLIKFLLIISSWICSFFATFETFSGCLVEFLLMTDSWVCFYLHFSVFFE